MSQTLPFHVYPTRGNDNPPPPHQPDVPGVFEVPGTFENGARLLLAYDAGGTIRRVAMLEHGADLARATLELHRVARSS